MNRISDLAASAAKYRVLLQLGLLVVGLLAVSLGGGAPDCLPDGGGGC